MKLLVISHACSIPEHQLFFEDIRRISGWEVTIVVPRFWTTEYEKKKAYSKHGRFNGKLIDCSIGFSGSVPLYFYHLHLIQKLFLERPDFIYVENESYSVSTFQLALSNSLFFRKPFAIYAAQNILKKHPWPFRFIEWFNLRRLSIAFAISQSAEDVLRAKGFKGKIINIPLGVHTAYLQAPEKPMDSTDRPAQFRIGYVGRLVREKGVHVLIHALSLLTCETWECTIIGDGPERGDLEKSVIELGLSQSVTFLDYVKHSEMPKFMKGFSVLVLPSLTVPNWREQFGRVIIEALASEVPVIGSDSGEIPFLIQRLEGGLITKEGDPKASPTRWIEWRVTAI